MDENKSDKINTVSFTPEELERIFMGFFNTYVNLCEMNASELEQAQKQTFTTGLIGNKNDEIEQIRSDFILKTYALYFQEKDILNKYKSLIEVKEPLILN